MAVCCRATTTRPGAIRTVPYQLLVEYDIVPGQVDNFLAALKENGAASVKEPGCREFDIMVSQKDPNHVFIYEVYENAAAVEAHTATDHFKKYKAATTGMSTKREAKLLLVSRDEY